MKRMSRRSVIRSTFGLAAAGLLARPYIANAEARTAIVWRDQGFVPEEDASFRNTAAQYEKASGNKIDLSIMPFTALNQKIISALTTGEVPDLIFHIAPARSCRRMHGTTRSSKSAISWSRTGRSSARPRC